MVRFKGMAAASALVATVAFAGTAEAVTVTWNTCEGGGDSICDGGLPESTRTQTGSGVDTVFAFEGIGDPARVLKVRAFSTADVLGLGAVNKAKLKIFGGGLGGETTGEPTSAPNHALDNIGPDEILVFEMPRDDYIPQSFRIGWKGSDADIMTYIGGTLGGLDDIMAAFLAGGFVWDGGNAVLGALSFTAEFFENVVAGATNTFTNNAAGRYLIIAARNEADPVNTYASTFTFVYSNLSISQTSCQANAGKNHAVGYNASMGKFFCKYKAVTGTTLVDGGEDAFKVQQIVGVVPTSVPEPATIALLGLGGLAAFARRRKSA